MPCTCVAITLQERANGTGTCLPVYTTLSNTVVMQHDHRLQSPQPCYLELWHNSR